MILRLISTDPSLIDAPGYLVACKKYHVGRSKSCDFVLRNTSVSRDHAELTVKEQSIVVKDLDSLNGTFVDGEQIKKSEAKPGQAVRFGIVLFQLVIQGQEDQAASDPSDESTKAILMNGATREMPALGLLSEAQRRVLELLVRGDSEKEVASKLSISQNTVHNHVKEIYKRMDVSSRPELLAQFIPPAEKPKK